MYVEPANFRPDTLAEFAFDCALTAAEASDAILTAAIDGMSRRFDTWTRDHYEIATQTHELDGRGVCRLVLPGRCKQVLSVKTRDFTGALTTQSSSVYKLHSSLNSAGDERRLPDDDLDYLEITPFNYLAGVAGDSTVWPEGPQTVQVIGEFGWAVVPRDVKRAVSLLVFDHIKPSGQARRSAIRYAVGDAEFTNPADSRSGIKEVDELIEYFKRPTVPVI